MSNVEKKITKARIKMIRKYPFFAYLTLSMKLVKDNRVDVIGVNPYMEIHYNENNLNTLDVNDIMFLLIHETLHIVYGHLKRVKNRNKNIYNMACDIIVNETIIENFKNSNDGVYSSIIYKKGIHTNTVVDYIRKYVNSKSKTYSEVYNYFYNFDVKKENSEKVYEMLLKIFETNKQKQPNQSNKQQNNSNGIYTNHKIDEHVHKDEMSTNEKKQIEKQYNKPIKEIEKDIENKIKRKIVEAYIYSQQKGKTPIGIERGIERIIDELTKNKLNWKQIIRKEIVDVIKLDYTFKKPSKKSISIKKYLPTTVKDNKVKILVFVDTSASITEKNLSEFISELVSIVKSFKNIEMYVVPHDVEPYDVIEIKNTTGILEKIKSLKGGGGTSHMWIKKYLKRNKHKFNDIKTIIFFTDGYSDMDNLEPSDFIGKRIIWVLTKHGTKKHIKFGKVVVIND